MYCSANWQLLEERIDDDVSGQLPNSERHMQYVWGHVGGRYIDDILLRRQNRDFGNDEPGAGGITYEDVWYHTTDTLFSTVAILTGNMFYLPMPAGHISMTDNVIGYAGYVFNAEIGGFSLYTVRFRHYEPELGRWMQRDPAGYVDGMNLYEYVRSDPIVGVDPFGLWCRVNDNCLRSEPGDSLGSLFSALGGGSWPMPIDIRLPSGTTICADQMLHLAYGDRMSELQMHAHNRMRSIDVSLKRLGMDPLYEPWLTNVDWGRASAVLTYAGAASWVMPPSPSSWTADAQIRHFSRWHGFHETTTRMGTRLTWAGRGVDVARGAAAESAGDTADLVSAASSFGLSFLPGGVVVGAAGNLTAEAIIGYQELKAHREHVRGEQALLRRHTQNLERIQAELRQIQQAAQRLRDAVTSVNCCD